MVKYHKMNEQVVLVDNSNRAIGTADKYQVHTGNTPLHRGFSLFIFNARGELLLQQRSPQKIAWPNIWSNSVCGHPAKDESAKAAAKRRALYELGIELKTANINMVIENFRYRYQHQGIVENEICPVMVAHYNSELQLRPNPAEVSDYKWVAWQDFLDQLTKPSSYSEWCQEEALLLASSESFNKFLSAK